MLVYDVTREKSFDSIKYWINKVEVSRYCMSYSCTSSGLVSVIHM